MADNPQQTVRELKDLVVAYAKQEATDPLKGLTRTVGFGLGGALLLGTGVCFLAVGLLRALQANRGRLVHGNWSWVPYAAGRRRARHPRGVRLDRSVEKSSQVPEEQEHMSAKTAVLPDRKITRDDIEAKLQELRGEVDQRAEAAKVPAIAIAVGVAVVTIAAAYLFGRRRGKKRQTVLEIRRI